MRRPRPPADAERREQITTELRREQKERRDGYRERALKLLPHVCASCGREFEGRRLKELTVHHRDHNHNNNPPDGSNWELLCIYCHDHEHEKNLLAGHYEGATARRDELAPSVFNPFAGLDDLLPPGEEKSDPS